MQKTLPSRTMSKLSTTELEYMRGLHNPWENRAIRVPGPHPIATQVSTFHGYVTFTANAAGFARAYMLLTTGQIDVYNDATHNETTLGGVLNILASTISGMSSARIVNGGMKIRSMASFSNEAGTMQTYFTARSPGLANYDMYRDTPH